MTLYEILGVPRNASPDEVHHAYLAKAAQLHPDRLVGAPDEVVRIVTQVVAGIDEAWRVLGEPALRTAYDRKLDSDRATSRVDDSGRISRPEGDPEATGLASDETYPSLEVGLSPFYDPLEGVERLADALGPHARASSHVIVPDVRGLHASDVFYTVAKADLHINFIRLTDDPAPVDGTVVEQDPAPGTSVRRHSTLTVEVWHPAADEVALPE